MPSIRMRPPIANDPSVAEGIEVLRDGHVIFTYGYAGAGAVLECIELLGRAMGGTIVRTSALDEVSAKLLVFAGVQRVEPARATARALAALRRAGVEAEPRDVIEGPDGGPLAALAAVDGPREVHYRLMTMPSLRGLAWMA